MGFPIQHNTSQPAKECQGNGLHLPRRTLARQDTQQCNPSKPKAQALKVHKRQSPSTTIPAGWLPATGRGLGPCQTLPLVANRAGSRQCTSNGAMQGRKQDRYHGPGHFPACELHNEKAQGPLKKRKGSYRSALLAVVAMARVLLHWKMSSVPISANWSLNGCQPVVSLSQANLLAAGSDATTRQCSMRAKPSSNIERVL